jgi:hypothetical protein
MAVFHRDGSNRTRDETGPDYSYFHLNAFLRIALICLAISNDLVFVSFGVGSCFWIRYASFNPTPRLVHRLFLGEVMPDIHRS